jgi:membrane protein required for colicin V production
MDRMLGMIFGIARGALLVGVLLLLGSTTVFSQDIWWQNSILIPHFHSLIEWLRNFLPVKFGGIA